MMTNKQAADILREISKQNLPTVNGLPFTEIKKALMIAAANLDPIDDPLRKCEDCAHRKPKRTESGTIYGCEAWECHFQPLSDLADDDKADINKLIEEERLLNEQDGYIAGRS